MASLIEKSPCEGLVPQFAGALSLTEMPPARITSVAPLKGREKALAAALKKLGLGWPAPGGRFVAGDAECLWTGRDQAFLIGADPAGLADAAALTDQSDGWARLALDGPGAAAVLARLVAIDLRPEAFPEGRVARTGLNHMMMILVAAGASRFEIYVFRSMARTAVHEIAGAMAAVAARAAAG